MMGFLGPALHDANRRRASEEDRGCIEAMNWQYRRLRGEAVEPHTVPADLARRAAEMLAEGLRNGPCYRCGGTSRHSDGCDLMALQRDLADALRPRRHVTRNPYPSLPS